MKKNFNKSSRFIRLIVGAVLLLLALLHLPEDPFLENVVLSVGIFLLATALINFCPLYHFLGINTNKPKDKIKMY